MGTGFFAFFAAIVGLIKYWGTNQFGGFVFLLILSYVYTEWVRNDVEKKGTSSPLIVNIAFVLQIVVIIMGFLSIFS